MNRDMENLFQEMENCTVHTAETSWDYYEMAEDAETEEEALKFARKALELDPDNIDAIVMVAEMETEHPHEMLKKYEELIEYGKEIMERKGYMEGDLIGEYWMIIETRPFMRLYNSYLELLTACGMMRKAADIGKEMIRYNENDNLGIRYTLMHIYSYLEDEESMIKLHQKYDGYEETQMLLPLSVLYYKLADFDKAEDYLKRLAKANKDTGRFMRAVLNDSMDKYASRMNPDGYRPFTIEELMHEMYDYLFLFASSTSYFDWAVQTLRKKK